MKQIEYSLRYMILVTIGYYLLFKNMYTLSFYLLALIPINFLYIEYGIYYKISKDNYVTKEYMDRTIKEAYQTKMTKTLFGRIRVINELSNTNYMIRQQGERMALNTPIQGTSADIIKKAMIDVHKSLQDNKLESKLILQVHDELILDVKKDELDKVKEIVTNVMEKTFNLSVPLKVDIEYGKDWYEAK